MIQKNGHIIAIDQAKVNAPLSGNGRSDSPIGLNLKIDDTLSGNGTNSKPLGVKSDLYVTNEDFSIYSAVPHAVVSSTDKNVTITPDFKDGVAYYDISFTADPIVSDTNILGVDGIRARWDSSTSAYYIGVSAKYLSANALNNYSGNWQNTYNTVKANSAKWNEASAFSSNSGKFALKTDVDNKFTATSAWAKATFASASQLDYYYKKTETSANGELDAAFNKKQDKLTPAQLSAISSVSSIKSDLATHVGDTDVHIQGGERDTWNTVTAKADKSYVDKGLADTSAWAKETFQPIGEYLSANALDDLSGHWDSVYNSVLANSASWNETSATLNTNSGKWDSVYNSVFDNSASWNETSATLKTNSGYWDSVYNSVLANSASWNETSAVVNENSGFWGQAYTALTSTSATWNNHSALSATKLDKDAFEEWSATTDAWDKIYYSGADGIKVDEHIISISANYLSANALDNYSGKWNSVYDSVFDNSASWNETSATLKENSGKWEESYTALTATSATWNNHSALSATKLDTDVFDTWKTDEFGPVKTDVETLKANSAHNTVESKNEFITVQSATNKFVLEFVSGDLADKPWVTDAISAALADFGGFVPVDALPLTGDPKKIYLIKDSTVTGVDKSFEWIVTGTGANTGWYCIGDTSMDLDPYLKREEISDVSGNWNSVYESVLANSASWNETSATLKANSGYWDSVYESVLNNSASWDETSATLKANSGYWTSVYDTVSSTSANWNEASAFSANSGKFVTSGDEIADEDLAYVIKKTGDAVAWSGIDLSDLGKIYPITSLTPELVSATVSAMGETSGYVLSAKEPEPFIQYSISASMMSAWTGIDNDVNYYLLSGANINSNNGISAEYIPESNQWNIGLDKTNLVTYARFHTSNNTYTTSAEITGFAQDDYIGTDIYLDNAEVYANSGLYHVDMQVGITIPGNDNNYHSTILKSTTAPSRQVQQEIDGSYAHTETISLSYDIRVATDATKLTYTIEDLPRNTTFFVKDLNVHRVICSLSEIGGSTYQAGNGLLLQNDTFSVDIGDGLEFSGNHIQVKLGDGLKFDENAGVGVKAITINSQVEEVVESVQKMENDLDSKLTTNFPMPQIDNVYDFANDSISTISNGAGLICQAFTVPINNPIRLATQEEPAGTLFGVYAKQGFTPKIMLALYVYDWTHTDYVADTGPIQIAAGRNEFPIKHINPNISELKSDCVYYAAIYIPAEARAQNGLSLAGCPSYAAASFINAIPRFTVRTENITGIDMNDPDAGLNILKPDSQTDYQWGPWSDNYNEQPTVPRFFMQIRNGKIN